MEKLLTFQNIISIITLLAVFVAAYDKIFKPQSALQAQQNLDQSEAEAKMTRLADRMEWNQEANENKFAEIKLTMEKDAETSREDIHKIDVRMSHFQEALDKLVREVVELKTIVKIINEKVQK